MFIAGRPAMKNNLTQSELQSVLNYDQLTGKFVWIISSGGRYGHIGSSAGSPDRHGHLLITIKQNRYSAHRLAWLYVFGKWPEQEIDHINGVKSYNRICNLRDVSHTVNTQNLRKSHADNKSGLLGVRPADSLRNPWAAVIQVNKKFKHIGVFKTPEEAHAEYLKAKRQLHQGNSL